VATQLGHSKPTTTLQFYAHWIGSPQERFVNALAGPRAKETKEARARTLDRCLDSAVCVGAILFRWRKLAS